MFWIIFIHPITVAFGIKNGNTVTFEDFQEKWPFVISIHVIEDLQDPYKGKFRCMGTILTYDVALTTTSCIRRVVTDYSRHPRINSGSPNSELGGNGYENVHRIDKLFMHPEYDFAIFTVIPEFRKSDAIESSMFPPPYELPLFTNCRIAGFAFANGSIFLQETLVKIRPKKLNKSETIWAQTAEVGKDKQTLIGTRGDRGGPLICNVNSTEYLVGITLFTNQTDGFSEFLNLSFVKEEIVRFIAKQRGINFRKNGQVCLKSASYSFMLLIEFIKMLSVVI